MKLVEQILETCGLQIPLRELRLCEALGDDIREKHTIQYLDTVYEPDVIERLYHEEQAITAGEYFSLWVRYIVEKIKERDTKIDEGHRDEVLPLDDFVRSLNAPPVILCEVFFRFNSYETYDYRFPTSYYRFPRYCGHIGLGYEFYSHVYPDHPSVTFQECTFTDFQRWFTSGVMQFVRTVWDYPVPFRIVPDYQFLIAYNDRIPELCQAMIEALKAGSLPPERFSYGFLNRERYLNKYNHINQIQEDNLFQDLPARLLRHCTDTGPFDGKPWGDFCSICPSQTQVHNLPKDAALSDFCSNCTFPCSNAMVPIGGDWEDLIYYTWENSSCYEYEKYEKEYGRRSRRWSGWCESENLAYIKFTYVCADILDNNYEHFYIDNGQDDNNNIYIPRKESLEDLRDEEYERLYYSDFYHPKKRFGERHRGKSSSGHKTKKTELDLPTLEQRVQVTFKKWDKILEPIVQTVTFITNHGLNAQGHDLTTWQNASNWLFEVNEKRLAEWVTNLSTQQMIKLMQLCSPLSWQKLHELLAEPIKLCKGECITPFKELIQGKTDQSLSESAQSMIQNEVFAQVYRLAIAWSKIC